MINVKNYPKIVLTCVVLTASIAVQPAVIPQEQVRLYSEYRCMFVVLYHEARGEPEQGQRMVAGVVLNRTKHKNYPSSICSVAKQAKQFSHIDRTFRKLSERPTAALSTSVDTQVAKTAYEAFYDVVEPSVGYSGVTHYHSASVKPYWSKKMTRVGKHGNHVFYR